MPIIPFGHQYLVTEPLDPPLEPLPTLRDPDNLIYFRTEVGGLVMGGYERKPAPWALDGIPDGFEAKLLPQEWERMEELFANAIHRVPAMEDAEVKMFFNGPEAFTPDADFLLGETDVPGFWIAAGGCAHGLAGAGGIGKVMSEWIVGGRPEWDVWPLDWRRFGRQYRSQRVHARALVRGALAVLRHQVPGTRSGRRDGRFVYHRHITRHIALGRVLRGEGRLGARQLVRVERRGRRRVAAAARLGGRELVAGDRGGGARRARGCRAVRPVVVSRSSRCSARARSRSSSGCARTASTGRSASIVYTQLLNARGGIEADLSVLRRAEDRFLHGHRHRVRNARPRVARAQHAARRVCIRERRHVRVRVPLPVGAEGARGT